MSKKLDDLGKAYAGGLKAQKARTVCDAAIDLVDEFLHRVGADDIKACLASGDITIDEIVAIFKKELHDRLPMFQIKATFLDSGFFGGCGMASNRHAYSYAPGDLPLSIKWGCCTAELTDFDVGTHTGNYVANGRAVAEIVRVGDAL